MIDREPIAEKIIWAVDIDGRGFDIGLQIGKPYPTDTPHGDWACSVALIGLYRRLADMRGVDALQALSLALRLARILLSGFVEDGGKLFWERGGQPMTVDEVFGGSDEAPIPDGPLTPEQEARVSDLSSDEIAAIDAAILRNCSTQFRKIARVVGFAISELREIVPNVPDVFYAHRVRRLITQGQLLSQGNITAMRFGEVRLPND